MPEKHIERVVYIDFGDPQWVPCWNPLRPCSSQNIGRSADEFVRAYANLASDFGDRTDHLLRQAIFGLLHLPSASLLDMATILRPQTDASNRLRARVLETVDNRLARLFWKQEFDRYSWSDVAPIQLRLGKLLTSGTAGLMLSQHESAFNFRDIMDSGRILLVDLSNLGPELRTFLASVMFFQLHLDASSCSGESGHALRPFDIYCDDAHRMHADVIDALITGMLLPHVTLTVAHQYLSRRNTHNGAGLLVGGSTLVFRVDASDAEKLSQEFEGEVVEEDLTTLDVGECIAQIGSAIVRVRTFPPPPIPANDRRDRILERSRQIYYKPTSQVVRSLRNRGS